MQLQFPAIHRRVKRHARDDVCKWIFLFSLFQKFSADEIKSDERKKSATEIPECFITGWPDVFVMLLVLRIPFIQFLQAEIFFQPGFFLLKKIFFTTRNKKQFYPSHLIPGTDE